MSIIKGLTSQYNATQRFIDDNIESGYGNKIAIYYGDQAITYQELQNQVNQVGNALKKIGIDQENRVLMVSYDSPQFLSSFYGAIKIGAVPIPVNTLMQPSDYEYFLNNSRAKAIIVQEDIWNKIECLRERFIYLQHVIVISESVNSYENTINFEDWYSLESTELIASTTTYDDSAFWLYSSGSTGKPKGVIHLQHDMEFAFNTYAKEVLKITEDDITFSASKLFFAYGLGNGGYFPLGAGASTVLLSGRPIPETIFETIEKYKPTIFFGVPTLFGALIDLAERSGRKYDLSSIRVCVSAGEALPASFIKKWRKLFGIEILDGIGSTEALHIFLSNQINDIREGSSGKIVPGYEAKIVNEEGEDLPINEIGDLLIKGDSIAQGYWNLHEENQKKFKGEWLATGDKYYVDAEGYFWYCGRSDDMLKVGGIWVSPVEIENTLLQHDAVLEVAVIGKESEQGLVQPKAYIVLKEGIERSDELEEEIKHFVKTNLAPYKYPRHIEFSQELPKTVTGKIQRFKLRQAN
jgi:benzoate-CoA ligase family protein